MPDFFGFDGAAGVEVRPIHRAATKPWAKDESLPGAGDGTQLTASPLNALVANLRDLISTSGIAGLETDDTLVRRAVVALIATAIDALAVADIDGLTAALAAKAPLASPALTGAPTAPTASGGTNTTQIATTAFVKAALDALINAAPGTLDTLGEIAAQLAADESAVGALTATVAGKVAKASNLSDLANAGTARTNLGLGALAVLSAVTASQISDASANGRILIQAADYAAMKGLLAIAAGDVSGLGTAATKNTGTSAGNVVALDNAGKLPAVDGSQLTGLSAAPVSSVAGKIGAVTLVKGDVGLGSVDNTADSAKPVSTPQQTALDAKVAKTCDTLTGQLNFGPSISNLATNGGIWAAFAGGTTGAVYLGNTGLRYLYYDGTNYHLTGAQLLVNNALVWNINNDGAGSGLDADLLDGYHAASFVTDVRLGTEASSSFGSTDTDFKAPTGNVVTGARTGSDLPYAGKIYYKPLQKQIGGSWITVSG